MQAIASPDTNLLTTQPETTVGGHRSWLLPKLQLAQPSFAVHGRSSKQRAAVEAYIAARFAAEYGAELYQFLPQLVSMSCGLTDQAGDQFGEQRGGGNYSAAVGVNGATDNALFIEQYLEGPIDQHISAIANTPVLRKDIVEIGNLAASHRGSSRILFVVLASALAQAGYTWVTFTATKQVAGIFAKLQCETYDLGEADPAKLGGWVENWGSYYNNKPRLTAVNLTEAIEHGRKNWLQSAALQLFHRRAKKIAAQL